MTCKRSVCNSPKMGLCLHFGCSVKKNNETQVVIRKTMNNVQLYLHAPKQKAQARKTQSISAKRIIIGALLMYFFPYEI